MESIIDYPIYTTRSFLLLFFGNPDPLHLCGSGRDVSIRSLHWCFIRSLNFFFGRYLYIHSHIRRDTRPCVSTLGTRVTIVSCITTMPADMVVKNIRVFRVTRPKGFLFLSLLKINPLAFGVVEILKELSNLLIMKNRHVSMRS